MLRYYVNTTIYYVTRTSLLRKYYNLLRNSLRRYFVNTTDVILQRNERGKSKSLFSNTI